MDIQNKLIVITGASSGIGAAAAEALAAKGGRVVLLARTQAKLEAVAARIKAEGGQAFVYAVDLGDETAVAHITAAIQQELGPPDVLINNAGSGQWRAVDEVTPAEARQMMTLPYHAAYGMTYGFLAAMLQRNSGHIINMTSVAAYMAIPGATAYATARWAMRGFSLGLAADVNTTQLCVTLLAPSKVSSPYFTNNPGSEERIPKIDKIYPTLTPEQVAKKIVKIITQEKCGEIVIPLSVRLTIAFKRLFAWPVNTLLLRTGWKR